MQDNLGRTGSNWTGRTSRTMREAFPQFPGADYTEPTFGQKVADAVVLVGSIGAVALAFWAAGSYFMGA